jgi:hypothetical protein
MRARTYPELQGWRKCLAEPCWIGSVAAFFSEMRYLRVGRTDVGMVESRVRAQVVVNKEEVGKREWQFQLKVGKEKVLMPVRAREISLGRPGLHSLVHEHLILTSIDTFVGFTLPQIELS